jgi:hypothetical protein
MLTWWGLSDQHLPSPGEQRHSADLLKVLLRNVCGWLERIERGAYRPTTSGETAATHAVNQAGTPAASWPVHSLSIRPIHIASLCSKGTNDR